MKTSLFQIITLASLLALSVSCGKDEASGGGSKSTSKLSGINNLTGVALSNATELQNWYKTNSDDGVLPTIYSSSTFKKVVMSRTYSSNCSDKNVKIFGVSLGNISYCNQSTPTPQLISQESIAISANPAKSSFPEVVKVFNGSYGQITNVTKQASSQGNIYVVDFGDSSNRVTVVIDTTYHPAFNPLSVYNSSNQKEEFVANIIPVM